MTEKKTHDQRIRDLEVIVKGDEEVPGFRTQLTMIHNKIGLLQNSFDLLSFKLDKVVWSFVVVGAVLMFIVYFVQTVDKLPIYIKPEPEKESNR